MKYLGLLALVFACHSAGACNLDAAVSSAKAGIANELKSQGVKSYFFNIGGSVYNKGQEQILVIPYYYNFSGNQLTSTVEVNLKSCTSTVYAGLPSDEVSVE